MMQLKSGDSGSGERGDALSQSLAKPAVGVAWLLYMQHIFLSDAPCGATGGDLCGISLPVPARRATRERDGQLLVTQSPFV